MIVPMLLANLQVFLPSNALPKTRLSTWKRVWRGLSYAAAVMFAVFGAFSTHAQIVLEFDRQWSEDEMWLALEAEPMDPKLTVVKGMESPWPGVEVLGQRWEWVACSFELNTRLRQANLSKSHQPWRWTSQTSQGQSRIVGEGQAFRWDGEAWQRLLGVEATLGASPMALNRETREWPTASVRSEGEWLAFATTEEGVHCIGYDELAEAGIQPEDLDVAGLRLFGQGGGNLPIDNDADRPLDMPQQRVVWRGLGDGSFDPGDEVCWHARSHERWSWSAEDGWRHTSPFWGDTAKWFLRLDAPEELEWMGMETAQGFGEEVAETRTSHLARGVEETHEFNLIKSGRNWFGDRLSALGANVKAYNIPVASPVVGEPAQIRFAAAMRTAGSGTGSELMYTWEGESLSLTDSPLSPSSLSFAGYRSGAIEAPMPAGGLQVLATLNPGTDDSNAWMDFLAYEAPQHLEYQGGQMHINGLPLEDEALGVQYQLTLPFSPVDEVWDVSNPLEVKRVDLAAEGNAVTWTSPATEVKRFCAFRWGASLRPEVLGPASNSNLHSLGETDYVIVTIPELQAPADSLAALHASLGKRVSVVQQQDVFDAFNSGVSDPTAIKMLMMMLRDRALQSDGAMAPPSHLLLMGDASYENRNVQGRGKTVVAHYSQESLITTTSYSSDDYFALTAEGQGERPEDLLQLGVGRIPASDVDAAWAVVGKVATYLGFDEGDEAVASCLDPNGSSSFGPWRNRILFVSDDQDGNNLDGHRYMENSEAHSLTIQNNHPAYDVLKVYPDAYVQTNTPGGERYVDATAEIARRVDEGALIVNYIGHGGERGWAHERILNLETIQSWTNRRRLPVFMTATCELFRHDDPETYSAGEAILFNPDGGAVSLLTTTRTVYSAGNQQVNRAFFETALDEGDGSRCLGDIYLATKNSETITSHTNARNFSLMGDPALAMAYPTHRVHFTEVPDTLRSLDRVVVRGYVGNAAGDVLTDFNGVVVPTVFDKKATVTTLDNDASEGPFTYQVFQNILHKGLASVVSGMFEFEFIVPRDIDFSYGTGRISCYALGGGEDAHGSVEDLVVGGVSSDPVADDLGPEIQLYINDSLFRAGDVVHEDPWLFARIFDESGINTSGLGIGHDAKAVLDGETASPFVLNEYFTSDLDTYNKGSIRFPFANLEEGRHDLDLKVWDVANNSATATTHFVVSSSLEVALMEVLAYPNPATDRVTFRMAGNQACRAANVHLDIFNLSGARVHSMDFQGEVLGFRDDVMTWDLKPSSGTSVRHGVYLFRVTWENEFGQSAQYTDKLVVLRPE